MVLNIEPKAVNRYITGFTSLGHALYKKPAHGLPEAGLPTHAGGVSTQILKIKKGAPG